MEVLLNAYNIHNLICERKNVLETIFSLTDIDWITIKM